MWRTWKKINRFAFTILNLDKIKILKEVEEVMDIINRYSEDVYNYKEIKRSLNDYYYCEEENILIGRDTYENTYAIFLSYNNRIVRNITFNNKGYLWRLCILTNDGVKFLRKNGLLKSCFM